MVGCVQGSANDEHRDDSREGTPEAGEGQSVDRGRHRGPNARAPSASENAITTATGRPTTAAAYWIRRRCRSAHSNAAGTSTGSTTKAMLAQMVTAVPRITDPGPADWLQIRDSMS